MTSQDLYTSYRANCDTLCDWLRLASSYTNPHRSDDIIRAAEYLGRVELLATMIRAETGDNEPGTDSREFRDEFDRIRATI